MPATVGDWAWRARPNHRGMKGRSSASRSWSSVHQLLPLRPAGGGLDAVDKRLVGGQVGHVEDVVALAEPALHKPQGQGAGGVAGDGHVVPALRHAGEEGGGVHRLNEHVHPRLRQLLLHQGGQAGAVGGAGQLVGPAVVAPLRQQGLGPLHVPLPGEGRCVGGAGGQVGGGGLPIALGGVQAQGLLVQGQVDGPADARRC